MTRTKLLKWVGALGLVLLLAVTMAPAQAQTKGEVPGGSLGGASQAEMWRKVRGGIVGTVSIPNKQAGQLVQSDGDAFRAAKNGPLAQFGGIFLGVTLVVLAAFFLIRGRIRIDHGRDPQGRTIERFNALERGVHWLTASSFILLAITGLNVSYGRYVVKPLLGPKLFGMLTYYGKELHAYMAFAFMAGVVLMFLLWVKDNIPGPRDITWLAKGGGLFTKGVHPPSPRFNAGQKMIFWAVVLGGLSLALSGLALMFPGQITPWAGTFKILNALGAGLPTTVSALQETQLSVLWHSLVALVMIGIIIAHIYIGSLGMEGAIDAVGSGQVDLNWAKEHHSLWVAEVAEKQGGVRQAAE